MTRGLLYQSTASVGPAGFLLADDCEVYERCQRGIEAQDPEWLVIGRGMPRERRDEEGALVADTTDEVSLRGIWRSYRMSMEDA